MIFLELPPVDALQRGRELGFFCFFAFGFTNDCSYLSIESPFKAGEGKVELRVHVLNLKHPGFFTKKRDEKEQVFFDVLFVFVIVATMVNIFDKSLFPMIEMNRIHTLDHPSHI